MNALATTTTSFDPIQVGQIFAQSGMFPDMRDAAQCATKLIVGQSLGLNAYDSMSGLHVIKGKVVLAANMMAAAVKASGKYDYRSVTDDNASKITFYDVSGAEPTFIGTKVFSMADAQRAGLGGVNWQKYPQAMLFARCISAGYREHCPDALGSAPVYVEAHGETELGVTLAENMQQMAALPGPVQAPAPAPAPQSAPAASEPETMPEPTWPTITPQAAPVAPEAKTVMTGEDQVVITPSFIDQYHRKDKDATPYWFIKTKTDERFVVWSDHADLIPVIEANLGSTLTIMIKRPANPSHKPAITGIVGMEGPAAEIDLTTTTPSAEIVSTDDIPF